MTGGTGFIGSPLLDRLLSFQDFELTAISRTLTPGKATHRSKINWIQGDLSSLELCRLVIKNSDVIIHLAHTGYPLTSESDYATQLSVSLVPTMNLLQAIKESALRHRFILASSGGAVYGKSEFLKPFSEDDVCFPVNSYGVQKLAIENFARIWADRGYMSCVILRISNAYGSFLSNTRMQGLIGIALGSALRGLPVRIFGGVDNVRDYINIEDICSAVIKTLTLRRSFEIINVGTGVGYKVSEVLDTIEQAIGATINRYHVDTTDTSALPEWNVLNIAKAKEILGWEPNISLDEGIKVMVEKFSNLDY